MNELDEPIDDQMPNVDIGADVPVPKRLLAEANTGDEAVHDDNEDEDDDIVVAVASPDTTFDPVAELSGENTEPS